VKHLSYRDEVERPFVQIEFPDESGTVTTCGYVDKSSNDVGYFNPFLQLMYKLLLGHLYNLLYTNLSTSNKQPSYLGFI
jgi:hypothetical protein